MKTVLITGFEPFDDELLNPSWEVVSQLNDRLIGNTKVIARQLPCVFGAAVDEITRLIDELKPELVIAVGQAGGGRISALSAWRSMSMMRASRIMPVISRWMNRLFPADLPRTFPHCR